jgi:hypothetical protein
MPVMESASSLPVPRHAVRTAGQTAKVLVSRCKLTARTAERAASIAVTLRFASGVHVSPTVRSGS